MIVKTVIICVISVDEISDSFIRIIEAFLQTVSLAFQFIQNILYTWIIIKLR